MTPKEKTPFFLAKSDMLTSRFRQFFYLHADKLPGCKQVAFLREMAKFLEGCAVLKAAYEADPSRIYSRRAVYFPAFLITCFMTDCGHKDAEINEILDKIY